MAMPEGRMRSIWYFVGLMLLVAGGLVLAAGLGDLFSPPGRSTVLAETHPAVWWSAVMIVAGGLFLYYNRDSHHDVHG
jgi:hypothetical protein